MGKYRIELLLDKVGGAKLEMSKKLKVGPGAVKNIFKNMKATINTQKQYTKAFNNIFNTKYTREYLFETIEQGETEQS